MVAQTQIQIKMKAYYYRIAHKEDPSDIVLEGIIKDAEDMIYPRQETEIEELPYECEAHHFDSPNYKLVGWNIELTRDQARLCRC